MSLEDEKELESIQVFHQFLQGKVPPDVRTRKIKKMNPSQAFTVIWFLQEHCRLLSDRFELCSNCNDIYDSDSEGRFEETSGKHFCGGCEYLTLGTDNAKPKSLKRPVGRTK